MNNIIYNAIRTPDGTILVSRHTHDYKTHKDANGETYMVDGGLDYARRNLCKEPYEELTLYDSEPHLVQRDAIVWGTYGKNNDQPLTYKKVSAMSDAHIEAVLAECNPKLVIKNCLEKELKLRKAGKLSHVVD